MNFALVAWLWLSRLGSSVLRLNYRLINGQSTDINVTVTKLLLLEYTLKVTRTDNCIFP